MHNECIKRTKCWIKCEVIEVQRKRENHNNMAYHILKSYIKERLLGQRVKILMFEKVDFSKTAAESYYKHFNTPENLALRDSLHSGILKVIFRNRICRSYGILGSLIEKPALRSAFQSQEHTKKT
uniref:Uncharacterized protein n=1 Tax=Glossina austeni TaxID=7395 RepID=A0A1A9UL88_GLOAU